MDDPVPNVPGSEPIKEHDTLKYSLLGPSLTKSGQEDVDQKRVSEVIYEASKGSKYFSREEARDQNLTKKIERILSRKQELEMLDLASDRRKADDYIAELEFSRDLSQYVVHIDCDAFYAAVEQLDRPELKELPFSVGIGVLTTCNYHARKFGCRSGMAGFVAKKLCPDLIQLPLNFEKYTAKAREVREILVDYDPRFESASIDEAYLNITEYCEKHNIGPEDAVEQLRHEIVERTKITVSAGIAANSRLAKIASNLNKPNGTFRVPNERSSIMAFMRKLPTRKVNGVGRVFERELDAIGVKTCGDVFTERQYLRTLFGDKAFAFLMQCYLGLGRTKVQPAEEYERRSIGTESTFTDMQDPTELEQKLRKTAENLEEDMLRTQFKGRTLCLKIKLHTYEVFTKQRSIAPKAIHLADDLYNYALPLLKKFEREFPGLKLRLMGLRCSHLVSMQKPDVLGFLGFQKSSCDNTDTELDMFEEWPNEVLLEYTERQEHEDDLPGLESLSRDIDKHRHHGKEIVPNPKRRITPETGCWECPVCCRPHAASEKEFNEHIDLCLSRSTIRDAVQETTCAQNPPSKRFKISSDRVKLPSGVSNGPRQRKLCFG